MTENDTVHVSVEISKAANHNLKLLQVLRSFQRKEQLLTWLFENLEESGKALCELSNQSSLPQV